MQLFASWSHFMHLYAIFNCDQQEAANDVISGTAVDYVGMDVPGKKTWSNGGRIIQLWPARPVLCTFVQYLIAFCSRPAAASDVISGKFVGPTVFNKRGKFRDSRLNDSWEIVFLDNFQLEAVGDVISGGAVE